MRSLFLKIFLAFWGTVIGTAITVALALRLGPHATPVRWHLAWGCAFLISGGICYLLTRSLTGPVLRLRTAARRLAEGDLTARAMEAAPRRDEIGELLRDFNFMAGRVEALVTSQRQLISDISHELRSPLARVNAAVGVARQRLGQDATFDRIERDAERLNDIIGRLLTVARLDTVATPTHKEPIDLMTVIREIVADAEWESVQRGCRIEVGGSGRCQLEADADLLRSAIEDVIRNAIRYTAPGTSVDVHVQCDGSGTSEEAVVRVADRGPGVPEEELSNIFRPFHRVAGARDRQSGGVGLGLAIAERVVRAHGGRAEAKNRPGGGLEVLLTFGRSGNPEMTRA
jgi:two-component system sensor histidine kinase CpxA